MVVHRKEGVIVNKSITKHGAEGRPIAAEAGGVTPRASWRRAGSDERKNLLQAATDAFVRSVESHISAVGISDRIGPAQLGYYLLHLGDGKPQISERECARDWCTYKGGTRRMSAERLLRAALVARRMWGWDDPDGIVRLVWSEQPGWTAGEQEEVSRLNAAVARDEQCQIDEEIERLAESVLYLRERYGVSADEALRRIRERLPQVAITARVEDQLRMAELLRRLPQSEFDLQEWFHSATAPAKAKRKAK